MSGRRVLVTGGTGSVGAELVRAFSGRGHVVYFQFAHNTSRAEELSHETGARGLQFDFTADSYGAIPSVEVLVNNAGINISREMTAEVSDDEWRRTLQVNLDAAFRLTKIALPDMIAARWGRIITISSIYGFRVTSRNLPYNVSKHGLRALSATLAKEYAEFGITANEICPGPIYSDLMNRIAKERATAEASSPADYFARLEGMIPARRLAKPEDIAAAVLFLASDEAGYINGVSLPVDGGLTA